MNKAMLGVIAVLLTLILFVLVGGAGYYFWDKSQQDASRRKVSSAMIDKNSRRQAEICPSLIASALDDYREAMGEYPASLEELSRARTKEGKPFIEPDFLTDPWKKPYRYDPKGPKSGGKSPDVWTVAPDGKEYGNWNKP